MHKVISRGIEVGWASEADCKTTIASVYQRTGRYIDPHTAVAKFVADQKGMV
jgi:threonine synthase